MSTTTVEKAPPSGVDQSKARPRNRVDGTPCDPTWLIDDEVREKADAADAARRKAQCPVERRAQEGLSRHVAALFSKGDVRDDKRRAAHLVRGARAKTERRARKLQRRATRAARVSPYRRTTRRLPLKVTTSVAAIRRARTCGGGRPASPPARRVASRSGESSGEPCSSPGDEPSPAPIAGRAGRLSTADWLTATRPALRVRARRHRSTRLVGVSA